MKRQTAITTFMNTNTQRLLNSNSATGAILRGEVRTNRNQPSPGTFSLVRQFMNEARPTCVVYLLGNPTFRKPGDADLLDSNEVESRDQRSRCFVLKIVPLVADLLMDIPQHRHSLQPAIRASFPSCDLSLGDAKLPLRGFIKARVLNLRTVRKGCERLDANVNPYTGTNRFEWAFGNTIAGNDGIPLRAFSLGYDLFDCPFDRTTKFNLQIADQRQIEFYPTKAEACLVVDDRTNRSARLHDPVLRLRSSP